MPSGRPPPSLRILIASADRRLAGHLAEALARDGRASVVGTAKSGGETLELAGELSPDLLFVDSDLPPLGPLATLDEVAQVSTARAIVFVDETPELDWESPAATRIVGFAPRDRAASEVAAVAYELVALWGAFGARSA